MDERLPTKNNMGWAILPNDEYVNGFIEHAAAIVPESSMEIGAAYGLVAMKAIEKGAHMIINDICADHLDYIREKLPNNYTDIIRFMPGDFLSLKLPKESIGSILIARVFHMLNNEELERAINLIKFWLKPGGRIFITAATPYNIDLKNYLLHFKRNKKLCLNYPGVISDLARWVENKDENLPNQMQVFDLDVLISFFKPPEFSILQAGYIQRPNNKNIKGEFRKDSCGIIVIKEIY